MRFPRQLYHRFSLCFLAAISCMLFSSETARTVAADDVQSQEKPLKIVFVGDVMLDGGPGHVVGNGGDPFAEAAKILRDADLSIGNVECAISRKGEPLVKSYTFLGKPDSIPLLKKYFSAVSVANNHSGDYGKEAFADELDIFDREKLPYFGGGRNLAGRPEAARSRKPRAEGGPPGLLRFPAEEFRGGRQNARHGVARRGRRAGRYPRGEIGRSRSGHSLFALGRRNGAGPERRAKSSRPKNDRRRRGRRHRLASARHANHRLLPRPADHLQPGQFRLRLFPEGSAGVVRLDRGAKFHRPPERGTEDPHRRTRPGRRPAFAAETGGKMRSPKNYISRLRKSVMAIDAISPPFHAWFFSYLNVRLTT